MKKELFYYVSLRLWQVIVASREDGPRGDLRVQAPPLPLSRRQVQVGRLEASVAGTPRAGPQRRDGAARRRLLLHRHQLARTGRMGESV
jgi:hypothetical protein